MPATVNPRNRVITWMNPVQDIAFSVVVDGKKEDHKKAVIGMTYQQVLKLDEGFGNYQLVKKTPLDETGAERWVFVLEFAEQHKYNYELTQVGTLKWPAATQTFIIRRDKFVGLEMPFTPPPALGMVWTFMRAYQKRVPDDLDGLFVSVGVEWQDHTYNYPEWTVDDQYEIPIKRVHSIVDSDDAPVGPANQSYVGGHKSLRESMTIDTDELDDYQRIVFDTFSSAELMLPDVLESVDIFWSVSEGSGEYDSDFDGIASGVSISISGSENGSASAASSVIPEISFNIRQIYASTIEAQRYFFFVPYTAGEITLASILARLPVGVQKWPKFEPESHVITLQGGKVSVRANATASTSLSLSPGSSSSSTSEGEGTDEDKSVTMNSRAIPPTIHGLIEFNGSPTEGASVSASANAVLSGTGGVPTASASASASGSIGGRVEPSELPATSPAAIPTSGLYYIRPRVQEWRYGYAMVSVLVFDASQLA